MSGYNGWTNRATWCAALWLDNDEDTRKAAEVARDSFDIPAGEYDAAATVAALMGDDVREWQV